jgi:hypothetical protein
MKDVSVHEFDDSRDEVLRRSRHEAQYLRDEDGVVMAIGSDGDADLPDDEGDEGAIVDYPTVSVPTGEAVDSGYFASR